MLHVRVSEPLAAFDLSIDVHIGAGITALFGASGSGKTTLLQLIAGVRRARAGRIELNGATLFDARAGVCVPARSRRVGMVFQDLRLFPHLDVRGNLLFGHRLLDPSERRLEPDDVIDALDIGALLTQHPHQLSGGERQRVALGRTLLAMPQLLLMDEPLAAVDRRLRDRILPYLRWVHERMEIPVLYVTHSLPEILELTEEVVVLSRGRVTGQGEVFSVLGDAVREDEVIGTATLLPVEVLGPTPSGEGLLGRVGGHEVVLPAGRAQTSGGGARVTLRAEDVMLSQRELAGVSARNQLAGEVVRITSLHGRFLVHVELAPDAVIRAELTQAAINELGVTPGRRFFCVVKTSAFRWA